MLKLHCVQYEGKKTVHLLRHDTIWINMLLSFFSNPLTSRTPHGCDKNLLKRSTLVQPLDFKNFFIVQTHKGWCGINTTFISLPKEQLRCAFTAAQHRILTFSRTHKQHGDRMAWSKTCRKEELLCSLLISKTHSGKLWSCTEHTLHIVQTQRTSWN